MKTQSQHTTHATSSMTEINALAQTPKTIEIKSLDMADIVGLLLFLSSEMKQIKELLGILADDNISAQLEPKQKSALAQTMLFKCEYLADFAYADAQRLNEHLKGTSHHKDFSQNAKP
ncbi:hypothetical protein C0134_04925 [Moraxella catarrhalis]|mgnify:CR=1 FL=1|uniref:hypothetical protein n=1 Tax=Moraxella catarrhalis TaxID=480 RepID=UPI000202A53E|nr:hypothetical protein [Moraxella catarrhalis]EGE13127.1 hypothetical protein E9M_04471 [Moraxella catarrhalis 46P47B1]EKF82994.1 hypothetical protein MCRH_1590 [Moraxella catarrhalis RH4]MPW69695.1 hypothetical protein [Moraxella catarrhalis]MPW80200.1 hypothetical protein [Moraxella catarrhalis]MPW80209.1 hypothetical protein [Moraxella catarrhalis]